MTDLNSREREAQLIRERDNYIEICTERLARAKSKDEAVQDTERPGEAKEFARACWMAGIGSDQHFEDWWAEHEKERDEA
jgi:hypothetical protein